MVTEKLKLTEDFELVIKYYGGNEMKIKIIQANSAKELEEATNKFEETQECKATQTHLTAVPTGILYTSVVFYKAA